MKKKLFAILLSVMMVSVLCIPAFADWTFQPDKIMGHSVNYLNIGGAKGTYMKGRVLNLWTTATPGEEQHFTVENSTYNKKPCTYFTRMQGKVKYAINRSGKNIAGGKKVIMWTLNGSEQDSAFKRPSPDPLKLLNLLNYSEGVHYESDTNHAAVYFAPGSGEWFAAGSPSL